MNRALLLLMSLALVGCVQRRLVVTSEPSGALVSLNGNEVGRTPFETDFKWYGTYDVAVRREGNEVLMTRSTLRAPWWQYVPIDFVAELMPWHPTDTKKLHYVLQPATQPSEAELVKRAQDARRKLAE